MNGVLAQPMDAGACCLPEGKGLPFGWTAAPVTREKPLRLEFPETHPPLPGSRLRLTVAIEIPDCRTLRISGKETSVKIEIRYACVFQPFEVALPDELALEAREHGLVLASEGAPVWIFVPQSGNGFPDAFAPQLLTGHEAGGIGSFLETFVSEASIQPFNWLEGCVLDGLFDLQSACPTDRQASVLDWHLRRYFQGDGHLAYLGPHSEPRRDELFGVESMLPFAVLAKHRPGHPAMEVLVRYVQEITDREGLIIDRGMDAEGVRTDMERISIEGCYTVAYPLAVLAGVRSSPDFAELALLQLKHRQARLFQGGIVFQRRDRPGMAPEQGDWARAWAWYFLGVTRTVAELGLAHPGIEELTDHFKTCATRAAALQRPDGLWSVYLDEPATGADTSGSAGIAAGFALAVRAGLLPESFREVAARTLRGLESHLTPEGFLGGVAQLNRGGEALQRGGYRVIAQFAMGLMAQLVAAVRLP